MIKAKNPKSVSVIIPTFKDTDNLIKCLKALYSQSYPIEHIEIIVVNNDPNEDISYLQEQFLKLIILNENKVGSYAARNKGIEYASKEVLAFTDSDCIPDSDWIKKGIAYLESHQTCKIVGGEIIKIFLSKTPTTIELYDNFSYHQQEKYVSKYHFAVTANLFVTKHVFNKIGKFNERMKSGGDSEFGHRGWRAGFAVCYCADAIVRHQAIHDIKILLGKTRRVAGGKFQRDEMATKPLNKFVSNLLLSYFSSIIKAFKIRQKVSISSFIKLFFLEIFIQTTTLIEYVRLRFGSSPIRSY